jgi:hypothetical protein
MISDKKKSKPKCYACGTLAGKYYRSLDGTVWKDLFRQTS